MLNAFFLPTTYFHVLAGVLERSLDFFAVGHCFRHDIGGQLRGDRRSHELERFDHVLLVGNGRIVDFSFD